MNYTFCTSDDVNIYAKAWQPDNSCIGLIVLIHGFGEHLGRYEHVADFFTKKGLAFAAIDRRGHGQSDGQRGHFPSIDRELDDLTQHLEEAQKRFPDVPTFLYGHSQGGNFGLNLLLRRKPDVAGTIITSPWLTLVEEPPKWLISVSKFLNNILPKLPNDAKVGVLSRDPEVDKKYAADPLVHGKISVRGAIETMNGAEWLLGLKQKIDVPVLLMHGTGDTITSHESSQQFYNNTQKSVDVKWWDGFYHEMHNEPEKEEVLDYMYQWMKKYL